MNVNQVAGRGSSPLPRSGKRARRALILAPVFVLASVALSGGTAGAHTYDDSNPATTGCVNTVKDVSSAGFYDGWGNRRGVVKFRESTGCHTAWMLYTRDATSLTCN